MKLHNLAVIFIVIALPLILITSYYISLQIDTINMQTAYNTKLLDSTKEAIDAFEINTVEWNANYSETADSKRRDIMASINTFTTSFANNTGISGASREYILAYMPAIAYTLYDGYYIYSPAETKIALTDENGVGVTMNAELAEEVGYTAYNDEKDEGKLLYKVGKDEDGNPYLGDGTYSIKAYLDVNYSMDVYNAGKTNGTNLQIFSYNKSDAQKWIIKDVGNGYYSIISLCNNLSLDVYNASTVNGTKIQLYESNGTNAQKFKFNEVKEVGSKTINDGYYFIGSSLNNNKVLDIANGTIAQNTNVQIYDINSSLAQKWYIKYQNNGYYKIISNKNENYCLEVENSGTNVQIATCNGNNNQNWIIKKTYDNNYYIINENGFYLDLYLASLVNGTNIGTFEGNGTKAQKFNFIKTAQGTSSKVISNGLYRIVSALDNNMVLDLYNGFSSNGTNVQLYKSNGSNAQKFEVTYLDNGYYKISSMLDLTKSFDVASAGVKNGTNVQIYDNNNSLAQQWVIKDAGNGYFYIVSNCNGLYLDVANGSATNGANIWMYEKNESKAQKFKFVKTEEKTKVVDVSYHQGSIDWDKVYNSGIYGVILRIGYWNTEDERFAEYIDEVKRLGIPYGIYIFSYANTTNGASIEANFTNSIIKKYNLNPTLGIYYDLEDWYLSADNTSNTLSKTDYDNIASTYINTVSSYVGSKYKVKIYANLNFVNNRFGDYARKETDWIAHYASECGYKGNYSLWQYTSEATLGGIRGYVDMNYLY